MPDQPQWSEHTLDMPPQDPWADPPTTPYAAEPATQAAPESPFSRGRAQVTPGPRRQPFAADHEPTGTGWPGAETPGERRSVSAQMPQQTKANSSPELLHSPPRRSSRICALTERRSPGVSAPGQPVPVGS